MSPNTRAPTVGALVITMLCGIIGVHPQGLASIVDAGAIELLIHGDEGTLHIDMGAISEDVMPNKILDTEDTPINGSGVGDGVLDPDEEDTGLDGVFGHDPFDFWDLNGDCEQQDDEPLSRDDWYFYITLLVLSPAL